MAVAGGDDGKSEDTAAMKVRVRARPRPRPRPGARIKAKAKAEVEEEVRGKEEVTAPWCPRKPHSS